MRGGEESLRTSEGSKQEPAPILDAVEHAFDNVACFIEFGVVFELHLAVFAEWNAGWRFDLEQPVAQVIGIVSAIGNDCKVLANMTLKAVTGLGNIGPVARRQVQMDRMALTIAHQMQFGIQPALSLADDPPLTFISVLGV